ncbi:hypothetical protein [Phocaeicola plebeius]|jgi:hypothetical protein|nr:hypothetical protein [Phocaeicola plebeius]
MKLYDYIMGKVFRCITLAPFMCLFFVCSCRTIKYVPVESYADSVVVEKLVEVQLPPDSVTIRALLECDENGKVVLNWLDIANSKNAEAQLTIDSLGNLLAKMKTQKDTVYLPSKEVTVTKEVKVPYPVEKELTRWQQFRMDFGGWAMCIVVISILILIVYKIKK